MATGPSQQVKSAFWRMGGALKHPAGLNSFIRGKWGYSRTANAKPHRGEQVVHLGQLRKLQDFHFPSLSLLPFPGGKGARKKLWM